MTLQKNNPSFNLQFLFNAAVCLVAVRLIVRCIQNINHFDEVDFFDAGLLTSLGAVVLAHVLFVLIAKILNRQWPEITTLVFYAAVLLSFPFFWILNALTFQFSDRIFIWGVVSFWLAAVMWLWFFPKCKVPDGGKSSQYEILGTRVLFWLWLIHAVTLFLRFNLTASRRPFADESTLWFTAAQRMLTDGFWAAHTSNYAGRGIQPLGVPFIAALPGKLMCFVQTASIFFMPVVVIGMLAIFLFSLRRDRFVFLFFLTATFATFHDRSWMSELCYRLVYGEGLSMAVFLAVSWQLYRLEQTGCLSKIRFLFFSFMIGLMALIKWPLAAMIYVFYFVLVLRYKEANADKRNIFWFVIAAGFVLVSLPQFVWNLFNQMHGFLTPGLSISLTELVSRLGAPNLEVLKLIIQDIYTQFHNFFYHALLSIFFILAAFRRQEWLRLVPTAVLVMWVTLYYAYVFIYPTVHGDWGSALRYYMPCILALYFYGAVGFSQIIARCEQSNWPNWYKWSVCLLLISLTMVKLF